MWEGLIFRFKWDSIRDKILESAASVIWLQETKRSIFDQFYLSKFCPIQLNKFEFFGSDGAYGGLITVWNGNMFTRDIVLVNSYSITVKLTSLLTGLSFHLTNIYGHCSSNEKAAFTS